MICILQLHICSKYWEVWRFKSSGMLRRVETSVILYQSTRCNITEHLSLQQLRCDRVSHLALRKLSTTTKPTTTNKQTDCRVVTIFIPNIVNYECLLVKLMLHCHLSGSIPKPWQPSSSLLYRNFTHPCLCRVTLPCSVSVFICPLPWSSTAEMLLSGSAMVRDLSSSLGFDERPSHRTGIIYTA